MNLKNAFRYEKKLTTLFSEGVHWLEERPTVKFYDHRCHAAYPKHADKTLREEDRRLSPAPNSDALLDFLLYLLRQKQLLGEAIRRAKNEAPGSIDAEIQINAMRRRLYDTLREMLAYSAHTVVSVGEGVGHYFADDGAEKSYHYDIAERTELNFNREKFGEKATALIRQAEKVSEYIEKQLHLVQVDYDPPFEVYCTLTDAFEQYVNNKKAAG